VDLYLAYGMNDQAISALEHAINEGHHSLAYRVRLLEAHGANDDADKVRQLAEEIRADLGPEDDNWLKRIAVVESLVSKPSDAGTALDSEAVENASGAARSAEREPATGPAGTSSEPPRDPGVMEFDTSDFGGLGATHAETEAGPEQATGEKSDESFLQFNLDELESTSKVDDTTRDAPVKGGTETAADLPPLVFTDTGEDSTGAESGSREPTASDASLDSSEIGMKLSLAEAFAEMGDREGALALLDDIASTGSEEQLAKVAEIRSKLDRA